MLSGLARRRFWNDLNGDVKKVLQEMIPKDSQRQIFKDVKVKEGGVVDIKLELTKDYRRNKVLVEQALKEKVPWVKEVKISMAP